MTCLFQRNFDNDGLLSRKSKPSFSIEGTDLISREQTWEVTSLISPLETFLTLIKLFLVN